MGLFRTLIIFFLLYLVFRFIFRYVVPILLGNYVQKKVHEMGNQQQYQQRSSRHDGEVTIDYGKSEGSKKNYPKDTGDYVDFEEIGD